MSPVGKKKIYQSASVVCTSCCWDGIGCGCNHPGQWQIFIEESSTQFPHRPFTHTCTKCTLSLPLVGFGANSCLASSSEQIWGITTLYRIWCNSLSPPYIVAGWWRGLISPPWSFPCFSWATVMPKISLWRRMRKQSGCSDRKAVSSSHSK